MNEQYDVAILGAGFEGSMSGIILACKSQGRDRRRRHASPFCLGESTVRHTFRMIKIMAEGSESPNSKRSSNSGKTATSAESRTRLSRTGLRPASGPVLGS
jgi:hypothetical protein